MTPPATRGRMAFPRGAFLVLALLAAGCASPAPGPAATLDAPDAPAAWRFGEPILVAQEPNGQAESFIAVSPDGRTLLTCLHGEFKEPSPMFASTDGGATWTRLHAPGLLVGGDCEVALAPDGAWAFLSSTVAGASVAVTGDQGKSWSVSHLAALPTNGAADRPWLEGAGDALVLAYMPLFLEPGAIAVTRSTDGGASWSLPAHASRPSPGRMNVVHGHLLASPDGATLHVPLLKYQWPTGGGTFALATSTDGGRSWSESVALEPDDVLLTTPTATALAGDGTLYWAYVARNGTVADVRVIASRDGGASWSAPAVLLTGWTLPAASPALGSPVGIPWMDGRPDGGATLAFSADASVLDPAAEGRWLVAARLHADAPGLLEAVTLVAQADSYEFAQVEHDAAGRAHVTFTHDGRLLYAAEAPAP